MRCGSPLSTLGGERRNTSTTKVRDGGLKRCEGENYDEGGGGDFDQAKEEPNHRAPNLGPQVFRSQKESLGSKASHKQRGV